MRSISKRIRLFSSNVPRFGDFTKRIEEASLKQPILEDNELR